MENLKKKDLPGDAKLVVDKYSKLYADTYSKAMNAKNSNEKHNLLLKTMEVLNEEQQELNKLGWYYVGNGFWRLKPNDPRFASAEDEEEYERYHGI